jgi:sugar lactone lactonase YvrE
MAFDAAGDLYIADQWNNRIRMVDTNGIITTFAGNGVQAYGGDGGTPTNASLFYPSSLAFDAAGDLYLADQSNNRVRVVDDTGHSTLTLSETTAANAGNYSVTIISPYGSVTSAVATLTVDLPPTIGPQPAGQFAVVGSSPSFSVAVTGTPPFCYSWYFNSTNLIQSGTNNTLTLPDISTNNAGNYTVAITNNYGAVTSQGAVLTVGFPPTVAVQPAGQTNLAGTAASFTVTPGGTVPFSYQWRFNGANLPNNMITTVAGNGGANDSGNGVMATNGSLGYPTCVAFDAAGNMYIADCQDNHIRKVNTNGIITTVAGTSSAGYSGDGGAATNASLNWPNGVAVDAFGNLYIADSDNNRLRKVGANGIITTVVSNLNYPTSLTFDASDNMYIADCDSSLILMAGANGVVATLAAGSLEEPFGVALDSSGNLYVADTYDNRIREVSTNGLVTTVAGTGSSGYSGDGGAATNATLNAPKGVAFDPFGNLYVADWGNNRIREVATNGIITTVAGTGNNGNLGDGGAAANAGLGDPPDIAFDFAGNLYIADWQDQRIREVHFAGLPTLVLSNVNSANAGNYSVVITSPYGSVTSAVVSLTVTIPRTPPQIISSGTNFGLLTNQFGFNLNGAFGQTIVVDGSTNLLNWTPLFTNTANGTPFYFFDPAWTDFPWRYYRARLP